MASPHTYNPTRHLDSNLSHPILDTLADLVRINSVNPNYEGGVTEAALADYVEHFFAQRSVPTWRKDVLPGRPNVLARLPGRDPQRRIILEAHMDTVSASGMTIDPWSPEIRDGRMYGRGACDTKGGMAAMMHAVASLAEARIETPCEILFAATMDEEYSYRGVAALCQQGQVEPPFGDGDPMLRADAAIVAEPTSLGLVVASKGLVRWKIETRGKAAHSAKPHLGVSAIEKMAKVITAIQSDTARLAAHQHPLLGPATCNIGRIRGGEQINFVPDRCEIEIDRRILPGESVESVLERYQALLDQIAAEDSDFDAQMHPPMLTDVPLETEQDCRPVQMMASVLRDSGLDARPIGVPFCSDASKFGAIEIPSMILGPGSIDQAHAAVEFVDCEQVIAAAEIYRRFMIDFDPST